MKRTYLIILIALACLSLSAQPTTFTWAYRHGILNSYISAAKDQKVQGPCHEFATVAAVEAMAHIYFNQIDNANPGLNLSERYLYNDSGEGMACNASDVVNALNYFQDYGVIDDASFPFPTDIPYCSDEEMSSYSFKVTIPHWTQLTSISNNTQLKQAIMDNGPLIVRMGGTYGGHKVGYVMHDEDVAHTVLVIGWGAGTNSWHIKDSWPDDPSIDYFTVDLFNYDPYIYRVDPIYNSEEIQAVSGSTGYLLLGSPRDEDEDGFYTWGLDTNSRPSGWPGTSKMDWDDSTPAIIFRDEYTPLPGPSISGPSYVCPSGTTFTLEDVPSIMTSNVTWAITPSNSCSPYSGTGDEAEITPSTYIGKNCKITFTITYGGGTVTYEKDFVINGPKETLVSVSVQDGYGGSPPKYGSTYYLCPNTTYYIIYNNSDAQCTTSDFDWDLPYGWSEYWSYGSTVAINTNSYPDGMLDIKAKTSCCSPSTRVKVYTQYFGEGECGDNFMIYPNPSDDYIVIDIIKEKMSAAELSLDAEYTVTILDQLGTAKYSSKFKGFPYRLDTSNLPKGLYFINISYKDKKSTIRLAIER